MLFRTELNCNNRMHTRLCVLGRNGRPVRFIRDVKNFGSAGNEIECHATRASGAARTISNLFLRQILRRKNRTTVLPPSSGHLHF